MVVPLPSWLLDQVRTSQQTRFDRACKVIRATKVKNNAGGYRETETVVAIYSCSVGPIKTRQAEQLGARGVVVTSSDQAVTLPYGSSVLMTDQLEIDGDRLDVISVEPPATRQTALVVIARRRG